MSNKSLIQSNPYLQDPLKLEALVERTVRTSCGVEGIKENTSEKWVNPIKTRSNKRIYRNKDK